MTTQVRRVRGVVRVRDERRTWLVSPRSGRDVPGSEDVHAAVAACDSWTAVDSIGLGDGGVAFLVRAGILETRELGHDDTSAAASEELLDYVRLPHARPAGADVRAFLDAVVGGGADVPTVVPAGDVLDLLRHIASTRRVLFHGSNDATLTVLCPRRLTTDPALGCDADAVHATPDPVVAAFYAVVDRRRYAGPLASRVVAYGARDHGVTRAYRFSLARDRDGTQPLTAGCVYVLEPQGFMELPGKDGRGRGQFASERAVRPIARLAVAPEDFPFRDCLAGGRVDQLGDAQVIGSGPP